MNTTEHLKALDLAKAGQWDEAHRKVQTQSDALSYLIHGYLHRVEGDLGNARYWYGRADAKLPDNTLQEEWDRLYRLAGAE